jgi:hypothetical protein
MWIGTGIRLILVNAAACFDFASSELLSFVQGDALFQITMPY